MVTNKVEEKPAGETVMHAFATLSASSAAELIQLGNSSADLLFRQTAAG